MFIFAFALCSSKISIKMTVNFKLMRKASLILISSFSYCLNKSSWISTFGIFLLHALFYKQCFFSTQPRYCLTFSWIELQMLRRCCLIHIGIIVVRNFLNALYLCPCLDLGLSILYLCDLFFIFTFISVGSNRITSWIQIHLFFCLFFRICPFILGW